MSLRQKKEFKTKIELKTKNEFKTKKGVHLNYWQKDLQANQLYLNVHIK